MNRQLSCHYKWVSGMLSSIITIIFPFVLGACFLHYQDKLKTEAGRNEVLRELQANTLTANYIQILRIAIRWIQNRTGSPFSLRSFGMSLTLAQAYQIVAVGVSMMAGGSGVIGELSAFHLNTFSADRFWGELIVGLSSILATLTLVYLVYRYLKKRGQYETLPLWVFTAAMTGLFVGKLAGFYVIIVPLIVAIFVLKYLTQVEALIVTPFAVTAVIVTMIGLESSARYGTPAITIGESLWVSAPFGMVFAIVSFIFSVFISRYLSGYGGATWAGTGIASIPLVYVVGRQIVFGETTQAMGIVLIFWTVLPFVNALNDYFSLGISHSILFRIVSTRNGPNWGTISGYGILDLLVAVLLMCLSALTIPMALSITEQLTEFDLKVRLFVVDSARSLFGHGLWFGLMILTTLFWTVAHLGIILIALCVRVYDGLAFNKVAARSIQAGTNSVAVKLYLSSRWVMPLGALVGCIYVVVCTADFLANHLPMFGSNVEKGVVHYLEALALFGVEILVGFAR